MRRQFGTSGQLCCNWACTRGKEKGRPGLQGTASVPVAQAKPRRPARRPLPVAVARPAFEYGFGPVRRLPSLTAQIMRHAHIAGDDVSGPSSSASRSGSFRSPASCAASSRCQVSPSRPRRRRRGRERLRADQPRDARLPAAGGERAVNEQWMYTLEVRCLTESCR